MNLENHQNRDRQDLSLQQPLPEELEKEALIRLLEERLLVDRVKRKVGEIIVRKQVETRIVEVPVKWEKLIIEQIGAETKQLAEINLGEGEVTGIELKHLLVSDEGYVVSGDFVSLKAASDLLEAIALQKQNGHKKVRIELIVEDRDKQAIYQKMFDRCTGKKVE